MFGFFESCLPSCVRCDQTIDAMKTIEAVKEYQSFFHVKNIYERIPSNKTVRNKIKGLVNSVGHETGYSGDKITLVFHNQN